MRNKKIYILLFLIFISIKSYSEVEPAIIDSSFEVYSPCKYISDFHGYSNDEIVNLFNSNKLESNCGNYYFRKGFTTCSYWFIATLKNISPENQNLIWNFYNNGINYDLYELIDNKLVLISSASMRKELNERPFPVRSISFPLKIELSKTKTYFVKATAEPQNNIFFINDITTTNNFFLFEISYSFLIGKYLGFFILTLIINLILFFLFKEKIFTINAVYIYFVILYVLSDFQFDSLQISNSLMYRKFSLIPKSTFVSLALIFYVFLFQKFTNLKDIFPKNYNALNVLKIIVLIFSLISVYISFITVKNSLLICFFANVFNFITGLGFLLIFITNCLGALRKEKKFIWFLLSSSVLIYGFISFILLTFGIAEFPNIYPSSVMNGLVLEILLLTLFLVVIIRNERKETTQLLINRAEANEILAVQLMKIQTQEKSTIAKNLHDNVGNNLLALRFLVHNLLAKYKIPEIDASLILNNLNDTYEVVRNISHDIIPKEIGSSSIITIIEERVHFYSINFKDVVINFHSNLSKEFSMNNEDETQIYLIINELLSNAYKHSKGNYIDFQLLESENVLQIIAEDNGTGYDTQSKKTGIGLLNIKSRVSFLKGDVNIDSNSKGTTIIINIPINGEQI